MKYEKQVNKSDIHQHCLGLINVRISETEKSIIEIRDGAKSGAKSSAGDKHETGRAMADLEIEKLQQSLQNLMQMRNILNYIEPQKINQTICPGSLIDTDKGFIYIAVGLGKIKINGLDILVISNAAPIVSIFKQTPIGATAEFNGLKYKILDLV